MLESEVVSDLLTQVASLLEVEQVPGEILEAIRLGRLTASSKPDGGVREIVVGDIFPEVGGLDNPHSSRVGGVRSDLPERNA